MSNLRAPDVAACQHVWSGEIKSGNVRLEDADSAMSYKVLVVDDEIQVLDVLQPCLQTHGLEVVTAMDTNTALDLVRRDHFHAALVDINLHGPDGVALLKRIKEEAPSIQVMMMTGYSTVETAMECLDSGAADYFLKPFHNLGEIAESMRAACERVARWENATHHPHGHG